MSESRETSRRLLPLLVAAGYAALLLAVFHRVWWPGRSGVALFGWDCLREYWPDLVFQVRALGGGELPLWNPYSLGGYPALGDPQTGLFSPVNWLLWLLSWLSGSVGPWLIAVKVLLLLWLGLLGMHALVVRRTGSHLAAAAGAVLFVLGSPSLVHKNSSLLWPLLFLPWVVLALEHYLAQPGPGRAILLGAILWLCGSAGSAQGFFYALLVVVPYGVFRLAADRRQVWRQRARHAAGAGLCALTAGLLLAATYLPAAQVVGETPRAERGLAYVLGDALAWRDLAELALPNLDASWMHDIYMGPLALVGAAFGLVSAWSRGAGRDRLFWAGLALFSLLCALGERGLLLPQLAGWVPGFGLFRIAYRYKLVTGFCLALLAAHGVADARDPAGRARWIAIALAACWVAAALVSGALWPLLLAGSGLALFAAALLRDRARLLLAGAVVLAIADLWVAGRSKIDILQRPPDLARDAAVMDRLDGTDGEWRYFKKGVVGDHAGSVFGRRELGGYPNPFVLARMADVIARAPRSPALLRRFGVRWWLGAPPPGSDFEPLGRGVHRSASAEPIARLYGRSEALPAARALARLADPAPLDAALVDPADSPLRLSGAPPSDARLVSRSLHRIEVELAAPAAGVLVLVLGEAYFPGWQAEVDGRPARVFRANYALRAVEVPAGARRVAFQFRPPGLAWILLGFAAGLLAVIAAASPWRIFRRRRAGASGAREGGGMTEAAHPRPEA
ncbi:MAG TPA: YfhO family protein [Kofleriaceae bacterium]|nr:YfhO family protein [Kofleriaceae bacterium]